MISILIKIMVIITFAMIAQPHILQIQNIRTLSDILSRTFMFQRG